MPLVKDMRTSQKRGRQRCRRLNRGREASMKLQVTMVGVEESVRDGGRDSGSGRRSASQGMAMGDSMGQGWKEIALSVRNRGPGMVVGISRGSVVMDFSRLLDSGLGSIVLGTKSTFVVKNIRGSGWRVLEKWAKESSALVEQMCEVAHGDGEDAGVGTEDGDLKTSGSRFLDLLIIFIFF